MTGRRKYKETSDEQQGEDKLPAEVKYLTKLP